MIIWCIFTTTWAKTLLCGCSTVRGGSHLRSSIHPSKPNHQLILFILLPVNIQYDIKYDYDDDDSVIDDLRGSKFRSVFVANTDLSDTLTDDVHWRMTDGGRPHGLNAWIRTWLLWKPDLDDQALDVVFRRVLSGQWLHKKRRPVSRRYRRVVSGQYILHGSTHFILGVFLVKKASIGLYLQSPIFHQVLASSSAYSRFQRSPRIHLAVS